MGLKVTISTGTGSSRVVAELCDSPDPVPRHNLRVNGQRVLQVVDLARAEYVTVYGRGNRRTTISFQVTRQHRSEWEATEAVLDHDAEIPETGLLELVITDNGRTIKRWLANAGVESVQMVGQIGATTQWAYSIIGGEVLKRKP